MSTVLVTRDGPVVTVTLNRPERMNALSTELCQELIDVFSGLTGEADIGAVVLTGAGKGFCAGGDVKAMGNREGMGFEERYDDLRWKQKVAQLLGEFPGIVIGAINGAAMGAGFGLALLCDFRIVARSAKFATAFGAVGFSGDYATAMNLTRLIGPAKAKELMILNNRLTAEEADALGLVTRLVEDADLMTEAMAFAEQIASGPRVAHRLMKKNIQAAWNASLAEMLDLETSHQVRTQLTEDHQEASKAFNEKRPPSFKGR